MARPNKVLVAYDGSPHSKDALRWAVYFKRLMGTSVLAVKIFEPFNFSDNCDEVECESAGPELLVRLAGDAYAKDVKLLEDTKRETSNQGVDIDTELVSGNAASGLLETAKQHHADMIIVGSRGHGALEELLVGSVAGKLVSLAHVPVMVVKNCSLAISGGVKNILVAYDGSQQSKEALEWAMDIGRVSEARIVAVKVFEPLPLTMMYSMPEAGVAARMAAKLQEVQEADVKTMQAVKEFGRSNKMDIATEILTGGAASAILGFAEKHHVDLIVAGTRGHGLLEGLLVGSVTRSLVSASPIPVLVVKD